MRSFRNSLLLSFEAFDECSQVCQFPRIKLWLCPNKVVILAETDLLQKIAKFCRVTYLTASARMDTARKGSITAQRGLERCTVHARNRHDLGSKEYLLGLETGTIWARKRHQLGSKWARFRLENGAIWARS